MLTTLNSVKIPSICVHFWELGEISNFCVRNLYDVPDFFHCVPSEVMAGPEDEEQPVSP